MFQRGLSSLGAAALWLLLCIPAAAETATDKTLSPYFLIEHSDENSVEQFPLESTRAEVNIAGVIAAVTIKQSYRNRGESPLEASYVFPASTRAAVHAMKMTVGERTIVAEIQEKQKAKATYQKAKKEGRRTSLLEQERPNVFQMKVANIMPGEVVAVTLEYTELLVPEDGEYAFVYPTVVGPRFNGEVIAPVGQPPLNDWVQNPYLGEGKEVPYEFDIQVGINTSVPIQALASPTHKIRAEYHDEAHASVFLAGNNRLAGDRDFILNYRLEGQKIESGLMLHRGEKENFFLLMAQPPKRVTNNNMPPREYIFIVDVSGSMYGFPLDTSKALMAELLPSLRPQDKFNILFFSGGSRVLANESLPASRENVNRALTMMNGQSGGGGTRMLSAIRDAMDMPVGENVSRSFVMITDGYVSVETRAFDYIKENLGRANFFAFGIGSSVNRFLIEGLARVGRATSFVVTEPRAAKPTAERFRRYIKSPVLTGIDIEFGDFEVYDVEPQATPDLLAERPLVVFGKWRGDLRGAVTVSGYTGEGPFSSEIAVDTNTERMNNPALRYLWARDRIANLGDYETIAPTSERAREITSLGLTYNLLTAYTSFVAVDKVIVNPAGDGESVKQPLPLPKGVSNHAVGGQVPVAPEPEINALIAVAIIAGLWQARRRRLRVVR